MPQYWKYHSQVLALCSCTCFYRLHPLRISRRTSSFCICPTGLLLLFRHNKLNIMFKLRRSYHNRIAETTLGSEIISNLWSLLAQDICVIWDTCNREAQCTLRLSPLQSSTNSCVSLHSILPLTSLFAYFLISPIHGSNIRSIITVIFWGSTE